MIIVAVFAVARCARGILMLWQRSAGNAYAFTPMLIMESVMLMLAALRGDSVCVYVHSGANGKCYANAERVRMEGWVWPSAGGWEKREE